MSKSKSSIQSDKSMKSINRPTYKKKLTLTQFYEQLLYLMNIYNDSQHNQSAELNKKKRYLFNYQKNMVYLDL